jgi:hypothetical protein
MAGEAIAAALVGLAALWLVLQPLFTAGRPLPPPEPLDLEETPRGIALAALKEIDFDRETGKLSEADYQFLKAKYTAIALEALRREPDDSSAGRLEAMIAARVRAVRAPDTGPRCSWCGPRPEPDAMFCSSCGRKLAGAVETERGLIRGSTPDTIPSRSVII